MSRVPASPRLRGVDPPPYAVLIVSREADVFGDGAANSGCLFVGLHQQLPAIQTIAWFRHHGYTIRLRYFSTEAAALAAYPHANVGVSDDVRNAGRDILALESAAAGEVAAREGTAADEVAVFVRGGLLTRWPRLRSTRLQCR